MYLNSNIPVCIGIDVFGILVLVDCELPTSESMGNSREATDVPSRMFVSIILEVFYDRFSGDGHVSVCHGLQCWAICFYWSALDDDAYMDTFHGNWIKSEYPNLVLNLWSYYAQTLRITLNISMNCRTQIFVEVLKIKNVARYQNWSITSWWDLYLSLILSM